MKDIIKFSKIVLDKVEEIDDLIDNSFEDIKDLTDTAGDLIKPLKAIISIYNFSRKRKFKSFLKSYAENLNKEFDSGRKLERSERLREYLKNEHNLNFIYEAIDHAINSKSIYCSSLLGYYTSEIISKQIDVGLKELITLEALRNLNDIELEMFIRIYKVANLAVTNRIKDYNQLKPFQMLCEKTVEKLKYLQVLEEEESGKFDSKTGWGTFISTEIAEDIFSNIQELGIDGILVKK